MANAVTLPELAEVVALHGSRIDNLETDVGGMHRKLADQGAIVNELQRKDETREDENEKMLEGVKAAFADAAAKGAAALDEKTRARIEEMATRQAVTDAAKAAKTAADARTWWMDLVLLVLAAVAGLIVLVMTKSEAGAAGAAVAFYMALKKVRDGQVAGKVKAAVDGKSIAPPPVSGGAQQDLNGVSPPKGH
jgi:hypothetical protein